MVPSLLAKTLPTIAPFLGMCQVQALHQQARLGTGAACDVLTPSGDHLKVRRGWPPLLGQEMPFQQDV